MIATGIKDELLGRMRRGAYRPGQKFPTRQALAREFAAARGTIDKVVSELRSEGYLESSRGGGTYVRPESFRGQRHVFMVVPDNYFLDDNLPGPWHAFMDRTCADIPHTLCSVAELERHESLILGGDSRLLWVCPPSGAFPEIARMERGGVRQVLINRVHPRCGYVSTDFAVGIRSMLEWLKGRVGGGGGIGILAPALDMEKPYRIEREVVFHQLALEIGVPVERVVRADGDGEQELVEAVRRYFRSKPPRALFMPDIIFRQYLLMMAGVKDLSIGKDLIVLSADHRGATQGGACLNIPWRELYERAAAWAVSGDDPPPRILVKPAVRTDITHEGGDDSERRAMWDYIGGFINP